MHRRCITMLTLVTLSGCAAMTRGARVEIDAARLAHAQELDVTTQSPARWARYQAARREAEQSRGEARASSAQEAQLWLETAIAEAEQAAVSRARLAEEQALVSLDAELLGLQQARLARARENQLRAARELARGEVDKALARAATKPALRVKLGRDEVRVAAEALALRAELVAQAVAASAPEASGLTRIHAQLRESESQRARDPDAALSLADQALYRGLALLAALNERDDAPDDAERAALSEALTSSGFTVTRDERGLVATLAPAFREGALVASGSRLLARLCALANGYPGGRIALRVQGAASRLSLVRAELTRGGCPQERLALAADPRAGDVVEAVWLAY